MTATGTGAGTAAGSAPAARLLAHWWSRPTEDEVAAWDECWSGACEIAELLGARCSVVEELRAASGATPVPELLAEYERLLIGPGRVECAPYESLWRGDAARRDRGRLMGPAAAEIVALYRSIGLQVRADAHELPDHIAIEWEALAYGLEAGTAEATDGAAALVADHLAVWIPPFCAAVEAESQQPFYGVLARLTAAWTETLAG